MYSETYDENSYHVDYILQKQRGWQGLHCKYLQMFPLLAVLPPVLLVFLISPVASFCWPCHWWADCPPHNIFPHIGLFESPNLLFLCVVQPVVPATYLSFDYTVNKFCSICCHTLVYVSGEWTMIWLGRLNSFLHNTILYLTFQAYHWTCWEGQVKFYHHR